jgi:hypothetical protein
VVARLDQAFRRRSASLYYDTSSSAHQIHVFRPKEAGFEPELWDEVRPLIRFFDQFLIYAFETAPDGVIQRWAEDHAEGSGDEAVARIKHLRDHAPAMAKQWLSRATTVSHALGDLQADIVINPAAEGLALLLRLDSFVPGPGPKRTPIASSRQWMTFVADANEVERLIALLQSFQGMVVPDEKSSDNSAKDGVDLNQGGEGPTNDVA